MAMVSPRQPQLHFQTMTEQQNRVSPEQPDQEVQTADPTEVFLRAETLDAQGKTVEAEQLYRTLLRAFPAHPAVLHNLALVVMRRGNLVEAESLLRRAVESSPEEGFLHNSLGAMLRAASKTDQAEASFRSAIALRPELADAHYNLGLLLEDRGRSDEALAAHLEACHLLPEFAEARTRLAAILNERGELEAALQAAEQAISAKPDYFDAHYYRGWILSRLRQFDEALEALARASTLKPDSLEVLIATANALRDAGRNEQALSSYWMAMKQQPARLRTHIDLNQLAWANGRRDIYLRSFTHAREMLGDVAELMVLEGAFRLRNNEHQIAETLMRRALEMFPGRPDVQGLLARAVAGQGRYADSFPLFFSAINAEPSNLQFRQEFAFALLRDGRPREAQRVLEHGLAVDPGNPVMLAGLALAYREAGDPKYHALVDFERYVRVYDIKAPAGFEDVASFNRALAQELDKLHTSTLEPVDQSIRGGTQTAGQLFERQSPAIVAVRETLAEAIADYIRSLPEAPDHPMTRQGSDLFGFSGSWSCRLRAGGHHGNHIHHEGWISSAYYVRLPDEIDGADSRRGWLKLGQSNLQLGEKDQPECFIKPEVGRLVLFPSYYWHGTVPFDSGDRLTIAFDVVRA